MCPFYRFVQVNIGLHSKVTHLPFEHNDFNEYQLIVDTSNLVCRLVIEGPSLQTTNCSLKWAWSRHVIHFKFQGPKHTSGISELNRQMSYTHRLYLMGRHTVKPLMFECSLFRKFRESNKTTKFKRANIINIPCNFIWHSMLSQNCVVSIHQNIRRQNKFAREVANFKGSQIKGLYSIIP